MNKYRVTWPWPLIFSIIFIQCDKSKLLDEDIVSVLVYKIGNHSQLHIEKEYQIHHFSQRSDHEANRVNAILYLSSDHIKKLSYQFKKLRRSATRSGYGKNPFGWEYYMKEKNEQSKLIIDTLHHRVILQHENYFDIHY